jgi:hypothetical protein
MVTKPPPGTAETQSTSATITVGQLPDDTDTEQEEEEYKLDIDLDFHDLYYKYANEQSEEMRTMAASCLHEGFLLATPMEDIKKLQMTLCELLEEENKAIVLALLPNIKTLITKYCNEHAISLIIDPTPAGENTPTKGNFGMIQHSNTGNAFISKINDFSSLQRKYEMIPSKASAAGGFKKLTSMNGIVHVVNNECDDLSA